MSGLDIWRRLNRTLMIRVLVVEQDKHFHPRVHRSLLLDLGFVRLHFEQRRTVLLPELLILVQLLIRRNPRWRLHGGVSSLLFLVALI